jgi:hypothetical protein
MLTDFWVRTLGSPQYNDHVPWSFYWISFAFFTLLFGVFYVVAYAVLLGAYENYRRYRQKADLKSTGPKTGLLPRASRWGGLVVAAVLSAWFVVHFIVRPG